MTAAWSRKSCGPIAVSFLVWSLQSRRNPKSFPLLTAFTNTDFTEIFGCIGVVMVWPLNGMMTPGTPSQMGFAPSIGITPLIAFTGMVTGWLTARGTCPIVNIMPTISAENRMPNTKRLLRVCTSLIAYALL
jgi:hypothetical protein